MNTVHIARVLFATYESPIGELSLLSDGADLVGLYMEKHKHMREGPEAWQQDSSLPLFKAARTQLSSYFAGELKDFDLPVRLEGTPFQMQVWDALATIQFGTTSTYGKLAEQIGSPKAVRAVGLANGKNPISIVIPCHRIIGSNGTLIGYGGGIQRKQFLLDHEAKFSGKILF